MDATVEVHEGGSAVQYWFEVFSFVLLTGGLAVDALSKDPLLIGIALLPGIPLAVFVVAGLAGWPKRLHSCVRVTPTELQWRDEKSRTDTIIPLSAVRATTSESAPLGRFLGYSRLVIELSPPQTIGSEFEPVEQLCLLVREPTELARLLAQKGVGGP